MSTERPERRTRKGVVVGNKMAKTVVVRVDSTIRHPKYEKVVTKFSKYYAHDDTDRLAVGDKVIIMETRPLSKIKRWRVVGAWEG